MITVKLRVMNRETISFTDIIYNMYVEELGKASSHKTWVNRDRDKLLESHMYQGTINKLKIMATMCQFSMFYKTQIYPVNYFPNPTTSAT